MSKILNIFIIFMLLSPGMIIIAGCGSGSNTFIYNPTSTPTGTTEQSTPTNTPSINTGTITGQIKDEAGNPIANAYVIYYDLSTGKTWIVTADGNGNYLFENIPPGPGRIEMWRSKSEHESSPAHPLGAVNVQIVSGINTFNLTAGQVAPTPTAGTGTPTVTVTPAPTAIEPVGNCIIDGTVLESLDGGAPVPGATVNIVETGQYTYTDSNGYFSFDVFPGIYTVIVNKASRAQSKAQSVQAVPYQKTTLILVENHAVNSSWSNTSPTISGSVNIISGTVNVNATGLTIASMCLSIGSILSYQNYDNTVYRSDGDTLTYTIDFNSLPPGLKNIYITAIDINGNFTELMVNYTLPDKSNQSLSKPANVIVHAHTFGENIGQYYRRIKSLKSQGKVPQDFNPDIIEVRNGKTINVSGLPPDSQCFVQVSMDTVSNALSYKIYRSTEPSGPYIPAGFVFAGYPLYTDTDPSAVKPGQTLYYRVSACNAEGEGPLSDPSPGVKVLDVFRIYLQSPANNSTVTTANPGFAWTYNNVGDERSVKFYLYYALANSIILHYKGFSGDMHSYVYGGVALRNSMTYEWNITGYAFTSDGRSESYPNFGLSTNSELSNNGWFKFTTDIQ